MYNVHVFNIMSGVKGVVELIWAVGGISNQKRFRTTFLRNTIINTIRNTIIIGITTSLLNSI